MRIVEELMEIWLNEVCDNCVMSFCALWIADLASLMADFILSMNLLTISRPEGFCLSSKSIWEILLMSSRNRDCCIAE